MSAVTSICRSRTIEARVAADVGREDRKLPGGIRNVSGSGAAAVQAPSSFGEVAAGAAGASRHPGIWSIGQGVEINTAIRELNIAGVPAALEAKPFEVLVLLVQRAGEVLSYDAILDHVWGRRALAPTAVPNAVSKIRQALGEQSDLIRTIPKGGYCFGGEAAWRPAKPAEVPEVGAPMPGRPNWTAVERLLCAGSSSAWRARHNLTGEHRVFKFASNAQGLLELRREVAIYTALLESAARRDYARMIDFSLDHAPMSVEFEDPGQELVSWVAQQVSRGQLNPEERLALMIRIAEAVATLHAAGVAMMGIQPNNVMVSDQHAGPPVVRLVGFGLAVILSDERALTIGRLAHCAREELVPSCLADAIGTDVRSLLELLTRISFVCQSIRPPRLRREPSRISRVLDSTTGFRTADEIAAFLRVEMAELRAARLSSVRAESRPRRRWQVPAVAASLLVTAAAAGGHLMSRTASAEPGLTQGSLVAAALVQRPVVIQPAAYFPKPSTARRDKDP